MWRVAASAVCSRARGLRRRARAETGPVFVIPGRAGVPVVLNGVDISYAVVEGDWGLSRPGAGQITVIGGSPIRPNPVYTMRNAYHPKYGRAPERGRNEVEPAADRALPDPAENFSRSWSTSSDVERVKDTPPATITDPQTFPRDIGGAYGTVPTPAMTATAVMTARAAMIVTVMVTAPIVLIATIAIGEIAAKTTTISTISPVTITTSANELPPRGHRGLNRRTQDAAIRER